MTNYKEQVEGLILGQYYELAYRAFSNTSFSPEKRALMYVRDYSEQLQDDLLVIKEREADADRYQKRYIDLWVSWMHAKGRCISSMITGPANFPTRRAEKANNSEHSAYLKFETWRKKALHAITKPENTDIVKGTDGALSKMQTKLNKLVDLQETMKAANKIVRDKKGNKVERLTNIRGISETMALSLLTPDRVHGSGFPGYSLTNNNAKINRIRKEIEAEERRLAKYEKGNKECQYGDIKVVENADENRLQIIFDGKPEEEIRKELKSSGFRWSPKHGAWQRQLTNNAIESVKRLSFIQPQHE